MLSAYVSTLNCTHYNIAVILPQPNKVTLVCQQIKVKLIVLIESCTVCALTLRETQKSPKPLNRN